MHVIIALYALLFLPISGSASGLGLNVDEAVRSASVGQPDECRYDSSRTLSTPVHELIAPDDPMEGHPDANVVLVEFFDPNCTHCRSLHPKVKTIIAEYADRVRFYKKPFALNRHSVSQVAAMLVAAREGKFYEMVDRQLESPDAPYLSDLELVEMAAAIGLNRKNFHAALNSAEFLNRVELLRRQARGAGVRGTPTLIINRSDQVLATTAHTVECIAALIEEELEGDA